jgi:hypothetical protein
MGQYYNAVLKDKGGNFHSYYSNNGLKLMEHSWFENDFVNAVCKKIFNNPCQVAWVGDYASENDFEEFQIPFIENRTQFEHGLNAKDNFNCLGLLLVNESDKTYINMSEYYKRSCRNNDEDDWVIHPLPLLTAMGNGLGGGDYRGINQELIGIWAGEEIQLLDISIMYEDDYQAYQEFKKTYQDITKEIIFKE